MLPKCPTGIQGLDEITGGGLPRGRPTLVCGGAGCGKTLLAAEFLVRGAVQFNEPGVLMAFEETEKELKANVASLGFDLEGLVQRKQIVVDHVHVERSEVQESGEYDLEGLFVRLGHAIDAIGAKRVVQDYEGNGERNRVLYVLKARGMAHSNQIREFLISNRGVDLVDAYIGPSGVLTGSARAAQGALEKAAGLSSQQEAARRKRELERKREAIERQISGLRSDYASETMELRRIDEQVGTSTLMLTTERAASGILRQADAKVVVHTRNRARNGKANP
jgi:RecA/RadA recombinase